LFAIWANDNATMLRRVAITYDGVDSYLEFPDHPGLATFDSDDHKYVAVAQVSGCVIVNAADSDYRDHAAALQECGIQVHELCPTELKDPAEYAPSILRCGKTRTTRRCGGIADMVASRSRAPPGEDRAA
jgi:hypothetical protein